MPAVAGVLALVALALGVALLRARSRTERELAQAQCRDGRAAGPARRRWSGGWSRPTAQAARRRS